MPPASSAAIVESIAAASRALGATSASKRLTNVLTVTGCQVARKCELLKMRSGTCFKPRRTLANPPSNRAPTRP
jgi:hypothetical protein